MLSARVAVVAAGCLAGLSALAARLRPAPLVPGR